MIDPEDRFFSEGQGYFGRRENPVTGTHCNVWDWDQLRLIKVGAITVDDDGLLTGVSTDPEGDDTFFIGYLPLSICQSLADCPTIRFSQLRELDRLGPGVDLISYNDQRIAFKFSPLGIPRRLQMSWKEINLLSKLPPHPNIIPFDHIVLEDVEPRLTQVVDFLNLELGIMHQDIAPRNLLVDPETDKIIPFDFDWAANGKEGLLDSRDDVSGVVFTLYEIITNDTHNIEWTCRRELDSDVSKFRKFLNETIFECTQAAYMAGSPNPSRLQCAL
ncbi:hypothetical protein BJX70DRAFT_407981 [Aspergillus crustosus]